MFFIAAQIAVILIAVFDAKADAAWSWPFRNVSDTYFQNKKTQSDKAHKFGAAAIFFMAVLVGIENWMAGILFLFWYWLVADAVYATSIGQKWYYLGQTSKLDKLVKNGKRKALICAIIIITLNIIYAINYKLHA
jgi:hypothetical protein